MRRNCQQRYTAVRRVNKTRSAGARGAPARGAKRTLARHRLCAQRPERVPRCLPRSHLVHWRGRRAAARVATSLQVRCLPDKKAHETAQKTLNDWRVGATSGVGRTFVTTRRARVNTSQSPLPHCTCCPASSATIAIRPFSKKARSAATQPTGGIGAKLETTSSVPAFLQRRRHLVSTRVLSVAQCVAVLRFRDLSTVGPTRRG